MADSKKKRSWEFVVAGYDELDDPFKAQFERQIVLDANLFVEQIKKLAGVHIVEAKIKTDSQDDVSFLPPSDEESDG